MNIKNIIDLKNYPINQPQSAEYLEIVKTVQADLAEDGCAVLSNFLSNGKSNSFEFPRF